MSRLRICEFLYLASNVLLNRCGTLHSKNAGHGVHREFMEVVEQVIRTGSIEGDALVAI